MQDIKNRNTALYGTLPSRMQTLFFRMRKIQQRYHWFTMILWVLIAMGLVVRMMQLPLMEFKGDEFHFLTQSFLHPFALGQIHDVRSPFPIPHPPSFAYFLAIPASLTIDPVAITASIAWLNIIGLWMFYGFCRRVFGKNVARISTALLASMPWAVLFSRKIWNPDLVFPCQMLFLISFEHLIRSYKPWKLYVFVIMLVLFLQAHLLSLFSIIPVAIVLYMVHLPMTRSHSVKAAALFIVLFLPYISYIFGTRTGGITTIAQYFSSGGLDFSALHHNILWWARTSTGLGFDYLLGPDAYQFFLQVYHIQWIPYVFAWYVMAAACGVLWILSRMMRDIFWYAKDAYPPYLLILFFLTLWSVLLPLLLTAAHTVGPPHYWVSIIIVLPICFGVLADEVLHVAPRFLKNIVQGGIILVVSCQILFLFSFYGFLQNHHERITGDYGVPYIFEKQQWQQAIEDSAAQMPPK